MNKFSRYYRLGLRIWILLIIFFIGLGQVSFNKTRASGSLEQPVFQISLPALSWFKFNIGGKIQNLIYPALLLWLLGCFRDSELRPQKTILFSPLLIFLVISVLAYTFSPVRELSWKGGLRELLLGGAFFFLSASTLRPERFQKAALAIIFVAVGLSALAGIYLYTHRIYFPETPQRIWLSFLHPNTSGSVLLLLIPLGLVFALERAPRRVRLAAALITLILTVAMLLTFSRTAWLSLLIVVAILSLRWGKKRYVFGIVVLLAALLVLGVNLGPQSYFKKRVKSFSAWKTDPNIKKRMIYWNGVIRMVRTRPLLGYGPGYKVFMQVYENQFKQVSTGEKPVHAHNVYLSLAAATGIAGLGSFIWLLVVVFYRLQVGTKRQQGWFGSCFSRGLTAGLAGFLIGGLADNPFFGIRLSFLFWLLLGLVAARAGGEA